MFICVCTSQTFGRYHTHRHTHRETHTHARIHIYIRTHTHTNKLRDTHAHAYKRTHAHLERVIDGDVFPLSPSSSLLPSLSNFFFSYSCYPPFPVNLSPSLSFSLSLFFTPFQHLRCAVLFVRTAHSVTSCVFEVIMSLLYFQGDASAVTFSDSFPPPSSPPSYPLLPFPLPFSPNVT